MPPRRHLSWRHLPWRSLSWRHVPWRHVAAFASVALLSVTAAACSSTPSGPSIATLGQQVDAITKSTNAQLAKDKNAKTTTLVDDEYSTAFAHAAAQFKALQFPASVKHDANALVTILEAMASQAKLVGAAAAKNQNVGANITAMAKLNLKLIDDETNEKKAADALRADLGLPPETTTTTTAPPPVSTPSTGSSTTTAPSTTTTAAK
jgi:hypothetical protein